MRGVALGVLLSVVALPLAGCAKAPSEAETPDAFQGITEDVAVTETRGALAGVVVDEAIRPIAGANVTLVSSERTVATDEEGRFSFEDLEPGAYFLAAEAPRHESTQVSADVVAGAPTPVRIMLVASTGAEPYHVTLNYRGHIDMYLGEVSFAAELVAPGTLQCTCSWIVTAEPGLQTIVLDLTGTASIPNPGTPATDDGDFYWELIEDSGEGKIESAYDDAPFTRRFANDTFAERETDDFLLRVTGGALVTGTMDYDVFLTFWYREAAPDDWSFFTADP